MRRARMISAVAVLVALAAAAGRADDAVLTSGKTTGGTVGFQNGVFKTKDGDVPAAGMLLVRFAPDAPPARMPSGVFVRGGSLLAGTLTSIIGTEAEVGSAAFGVLKLKREDVTGAFTPLPAGTPENMPELARYAPILAATLGSHGALLKPGAQTRVRFAGLDQVDAEKVMRVGSENILLSAKGKGVETLSRQYVRLLEIQQPAGEAPAAGQWIVRLKSGDLIRGELVKIDGGGVTLKTAFMGERTIARELLAVLFPAGAGSAGGGGVRWLSAQAPASSKHTPFFDAEFPARADGAVSGGDMLLRGVPVERGWGVHAKSELSFGLSGKEKSFVALTGIDDFTRGRGGVVAAVLADGKEIWNSGPVGGSDPAKWVSVPLNGAKTLTLKVDFGPDGDDSGDHFNWGFAALVE